MLDQDTAAHLLNIGAPCLHSDMANNRVGYVCKIEAEENKVFTIGGGGMQRQYNRVTVVWEDESESSVGEGIATRWLEMGSKHLRHLTPISEAEALEMLAKARAATVRRHEKIAAEQAAAAQRAEDFRNKYRDKIPADAKAVILAELEEDNCDVQSDYFNAKTTRVVIIGFSSHTRDLFSELRKAARGFPETAELADAPDSAEHREKYSMGGGYYLKAGNRYDSGWKVCKQAFYIRPGQNDLAQCLPAGEWAVPETATAAPEPKPAKAAKEKPAAAPIETTESETVNGATISEHVHDKKGFTFHIVQLPARVERAQFDNLLSAAKRAGGWYSRPWQGTPGGFAFKDKAKAVTFAGGL
jgi:hypothetical protein